MEMSRMKVLRKDQKKTIQIVADAIGIDQSYYCLVENGKRVPSDDMKKKFEKFFKAGFEKLAETVKLEEA